MAEFQIAGKDMLLYLKDLNTSGVASVTVTTPGTSYETAPDVSFTGGGGSGAAGYAVLAGDEVGEVVITDFGTGYTSAPTVVFSGGGGSSAAGTAVLGSTVSLIACLTSNSINMTSNDMATDTKCGKLKLQGTQDASVPFDIVPVFNPSNGKATLKALHDLYKAGTEREWMIAHKNATTGSPLFEFSGYIQEFNYEFPTEGHMTANGTIQVDENLVDLTLLP